jgi:hypothetical protein
MLENIVDLVGCIFVSALTLLAGSCTVGSIVAALRAVSHGSMTVNTKRRTTLGAQVTVSDDRIRETGAMMARIAGD